jgi:flagellin
MGLNISALKTQQKLDKNVQESSRIAERLSSGMRITDPSDDAAGLSIISSLSADTRVYNRARLNISDAISAVTIAMAHLPL